MGQMKLRGSGSTGLGRQERIGFFVIRQKVTEERIGLGLRTV